MNKFCLNLLVLQVSMILYSTLVKCQPEEAIPNQVTKLGLDTELTIKRPGEYVFEPEVIN